MSGPSMQELIRGRRRSGFVGRRAEIAAFRGNFDVPVTDERHRFLFHVHGNAGVGKTSLVREWEQVAVERGALVAYVDEAVGSVPEAMAALSAEFARRGRRCKDLDRMLATHRERRHEAESAALAAAAEAGQAPDAAPPPSPGTVAAARAGLAGLGLLPGVGAFTGAVDPAQLAQGADRLRAGLSARFRSQEDVQLVLTPERVLTPVLLRELEEATKAHPWVVLFFDTYERTAPFLDGWLCELMTTERYGALPANVVVVTAGQLPFTTARWDGYLDFMADVPLAPFTDLEARGLLADKGVTAEPVVEEVLRLSGGLPVLVSTLAESRPTAPDGVGDPSATAVERFLKWEPDPVRRAVALACALPRGLDEDVFRAVVGADAAERDVPGLFAWLRGLPFVSDRGGRLVYHDVVRAPMLRLQRRRSPRGWAERHGRLAAAFAAWRAEAGAGLDEDEGRWADERWRALRLAEAYHLLCADERGALPAVLRDVVLACGPGGAVVRQWAQALADAGEDAAGEAAAAWGRDLLAALDGDGLAGALGLLLDRAGLDPGQRALAYAVRGRVRRLDGDHERALADYDEALALDPELVRAHVGRAHTLGRLRAHEAALAHLDRADALAPDRVATLRTRGEFHRVLRHFDEALRDLDRAVELDPVDPYARASRGAARQALGRHDEALADLDRALELRPEYAWALVKRARVHQSLGQPELQLADLDRAVALAADWAWVWCLRADALSVAGRHEEAVADYDRALGLEASYASAHAGRGASLAALRRSREALDALNRAVELAPDQPWALLQRSRVHGLLGNHVQAAADADRAVHLWTDSPWARCVRAVALHDLKRYEEAHAELNRAVELNPDDAAALHLRGALRSELGLHVEALADMDRAVALDSRLRAQRFSVRLHAGRLAPAEDDLAWIRENHEDLDWVRSESARFHLLCGRVERAVGDLLPGTGTSVLSTAEVGVVGARAFRRARLWERAREAAEALRARDEARGTIELALTEGAASGLAPTRHRWREAARLLETAAFPRPAVGECLHAVVAAGLADWPTLDATLSRCLALDNPRVTWLDRAELTTLLTDLLHAPDADHPRLAPRVTRAAESRDAFQERYA
ncbi:ATP-binding protein [Streptomyces sp. CC224B]|uniref:tetratricopeptide repeat protein n=1 Tax=Streptomyces sp. CC224B TaxID=3044571 RepID=UPI0024A8AC76|nr:ATP-binding protein [Streptomyces sp. CC224B]